MTTINILDLSKKFTLNLEKAGVLIIPTLAARLAVDKSGSMDDEFRDGLVDRTIALFTAAALKFDDDGQLEMGFFNNYMERTPDATERDGGNYLKRVRQSAGGGTSYAPIIVEFESKLATKAAPVAAPVAAPAPEKKGFFSSLFGKKDAPAPAPVAAPASGVNECAVRAYVGIITDGDANDNRQFEAVLAKTSGDTFFQFIAIGTGVRTEYLTGIAAKYPHVSFMHLPDPKNTSDEQFYEKLCNEKLASWIKQG